MIQKKIDEVKENIETIQKYVNIKYVRQDWHDVSSASNDIRELNAEWKVYVTIIDQIEELENNKEKKDDKTIQIS